MTSGRPRRPQRKINYINKCYKYVLFLSNFVFLLAGIVLVAFGTVAYILSGGLPESYSNTPLKWFFNFPILLIVFGSVVVVVSFPGCIGPLRENVCLLKFFSYILMFFFLSECTLAILGFAYKEKATKAVEEFIKISIISQYWMPGFEDTTNIVNTIQTQLSCCGPSSYKDYGINEYFSCNETNLSPTACGVPYSCCRKMNNLDPSIINTACGFGVQKSEYGSKQVWEIGCVAAIINVVDANIFPVGGSMIGVAILQLISLFLSRILAIEIQDQVKLIRSQERQAAALRSQNQPFLMD